MRCFQRFSDSLLIAHRTEGLVGHQKNVVVAALTTDFSNLLARLMAFPHFRLRNGNGMDDLAWQPVNLFPDMIRIHCGWFVVDVIASKITIIL